MSIAIKEKRISASKSKSKLRENLLYLMENATDAENINHFARIVGVPLSTMHKLLSTERQSPKIDTLTPIAEKFNITLDQLIGTKPLRNIANEDLIEWNEKLFEECFKEIHLLSASFNKQLNYQEFLSLIDELYRYCIKKGTVLDKSFAEWLIENRK